MLSVGNCPQRVGKDGLLEVATTPSFVVGTKEVGKELQTTRSVCQVDTLVVRIAVTFPVPRCQFHAQAFACSSFSMDDDDSIHRCIITSTWILDNFHFLDVIRLNILQFGHVSQLTVIQIDERYPLA